MQRHRIVWPLTLAAGVIAILAALPQRNESSPPEVFVDEDRLPQLPAPEQLAPAALPHFHFEHPRLPAPTATDLAGLRRDNPRYLAVQRQETTRPDGDLYAAILTAYAEPGDWDLQTLYRRLLSLQFADRGNEQTKPLAVAYDWLQDRWTATQRQHLRDKLLDGCNYEIRLIRRQRLSPYNVYLYNSPLQALMACAIALYGDDPRGDAVMAFTNDLWNNRVLPVWRQIMGHNGGWHEGGEYVGIGIGQAVYELPNMWRKATGEDAFKLEPGIRGFLDFLVYRTRPDGTQFRWGDASHYRRPSPDRLALAMEYHDAAGFSLLPPPPRPIPTSWPWGPLSDNRRYHPKAVSRLPLSHDFDGLGLIVARSGWTPDATYVTFKAGDNYWSHSHLDQGAFTVYKGGALAIDSGLYGPYYGSDHHMNYTYQTIAHNTITITDPADIVPAPAPDTRPLRPIANDGGQRRIGSGWGVESAPLDLAEWQAKRNIYHTGSLERVLMEDGLTVAVAELTPAYTNALSGRGTFSDRTRRVESFRRVFGYDRIDDVIVILDRVAATQADFRKRWLLHALQKPEITSNGFIVHAAPTAQPGHAGGRLEGRVLLLRNPVIKLVGGPGAEFLVDGKNYPHGVSQPVISDYGAEPGAWRVELMPGSPKNDCAAIFCETFWDIQAPKRSKKLAALSCLRRPTFALRAPRHASDAARHGSHNGLTPGSVALHVLSARALAQTPTTRPALPPTWGSSHSLRFHVLLTQDEFLVVLLPTLHDQRPSPRIRYIVHGEEYGAEVKGPGRTTRWWFRPGKDGVRVETSGPMGSGTHDLWITPLLRGNDGR